jgi:hypothetical protein
VTPLCVDLLQSSKRHLSWVTFCHLETNDRRDHVTMRQHDISIISFWGSGCVRKGRRKGRKEAEEAVPEGV